MSFVDDYSQKVWVYFIQHKSKTFVKFKLWKTKVENQTGRKIKCLKSDNGIVYTNSRFTELCKEHGIKRYFIIRKTPQQNGVAEKMNRSIVERARQFRLNEELEKKLWAEAVSMVCYL